MIGTDKLMGAVVCALAITSFTVFPSAHGAPVFPPDHRAPGLTVAAAQAPAAITIAPWYRAQAEQPTVPAVTTDKTLAEGPVIEAWYRAAN